MKCSTNLSKDVNGNRSIEQYMMLTPKKQKRADGGVGSAAAEPSSSQHASLLDSPRALVRRRLVVAPSTPPPPPAVDAGADEVVVIMWHCVGTVVGRRLETPPVYYGTRRSHTAGAQCVRRMPLRSLYGSSYLSLVAAAADGQAGCRELVTALDIIAGVVSAAAYPTETVLTHMLHRMLMPDEVRGDQDSVVRHRCLEVLHQVLHVHPPDSRPIRKVYQTALQGEHTSSFVLLESLAERCLEALAFDEPLDMREQSLRLDSLDFIVTLLEDDISMWTNDRLETARQLLSRSEAARPLVARALWPGTSVGTMNARCAALVQWLVAAVQTDSTLNVCLLLLRLVTMAAEVVRLSGQNSLTEVTPNMKAFAMEISRTAHGEELSGPSQEHLLSLLRPFWLSAWVSAGLLELRHARLRPAELRLLHISPTYLATADDAAGSATAAAAAAPQKENVASGAARADQVADVASRAAGAAQNSPRHPLCVAVAPIRATSPLKRRWQSPGNASPAKRRPITHPSTQPSEDGVTALHRACAAGDAAQVEACLRAPGLRVNAQDWAGRTALHEAAAAGHAHCVALLLSHRPCNILKYFSPTSKSGSSAAGRVDEEICSGAGLTAFHEAVQAGHEAVLRVMTKQLGPAVAQRHTADGRPPAALAPAASAAICRLLSGGVEPSATSTGPPPPAAVREFTQLVYYLLMGQMQYSGIVEVEVLMERWNRASQAGEQAPSVRPLPVAVRRHVNKTLLDWYLHELRWLRHKRWPDGAARRRLHTRFGLYMNMATIL